MLGQLKEIADRYEALVSQLEDPSVYADPARLAKLTRERKELTPVVEAYQAYCRVEDDLRDAQALLSDPEMKEMAQEELQQARNEVLAEMQQRAEALGADAVVGASIGYETFEGMIMTCCSGTAVRLRRA